MTTQRKSYRIVIAGAGPGGMCMAIKLREAGFDDFVILEREAEPGGTWVNNRYPGLACDVPSLLYSFSFEQKVDWTRNFADQPEIKAYMLGIAEKYDLNRSIRFNTGVARARWDDASAQWHLETTTGETVVGDIFISAIGMFNEIVWPDIAGRDRFKGEVLHTALWPQGKTLHGRRVAVVGSAASAVQMIPEIAQEAAQLTIFQRTANWVMPKPDKTHTEAELEAFRRDPQSALDIRAGYLEKWEALVTFDKPDVMAFLRQGALDNLAQVKDPVTREKLMPNVALGAQRPLFSNEFYPTFNRPNVALVTEAIECFTEKGIETRDGTERLFDTVILATGYAANKYLSVIEVTGRNGIALKDAWRDGPQAYLGITTAGFPNLFMLYGPNTNNGSILTMLEYQVDYIVRKLQDMAVRGTTWIDIRRDTLDSYNDAVQRDLAAVAVWRELGSKYYRVGSGRIVTQWPHTMAVYREKTTTPDWEAFETA
jgi:cation diffusion facilitator CzcD-associated flavoprotein CzcO